MFCSLQIVYYTHVNPSGPQNFSIIGYMTASNNGININTSTGLKNWKERQIEEARRIEFKMFFNEYKILVIAASLD